MTVAASDWCPFNRYRGSQGIDPLIWLSSSLLCTCNRMFQNLCPLWVQTTCDKITWQLNITAFKVTALQLWLLTICWLTSWCIDCSTDCSWHTVFSICLLPDHVTFTNGTLCSKIKSSSRSFENFLTVAVSCNPG